MNDDFVHRKETVTFVLLRQITTSLLSLLAACLVLGFSAGPAGAEQTAITVLNYVTGWYHDAGGYHPAVFLLIENTSGRDLSGKFVRFQGRFTDLQTSEVAVGRKEIRQELKPYQQSRISIIAPYGYELPMEVYRWPTMEVKVMCRIGNVGDEGTETLLVTKLESVAQTTEDAYQTLNNASSYDANALPKSHIVHRPAAPHKEPPPAVAAAPTAETRPLVATAGKLPVTPQIAPEGNATRNLLSSKSLPGLGDDFYNFEQRFGLPIATDAKQADWTWAKFRHETSGVNLVVGSKERTGKADLIVVELKRSEVGSDANALDMARSLTGKLRTQSPGQPVKSVRYLASGRVELTACKAATYRLICLSPRAGEERLIVIISRLQQDPEQLLAALKNRPLLKSMSPLFTAEN